MNERIKELANKAGYDDLIYEISKEGLDKLVKLTVQECLKLCKEVEDDLNGIYDGAERESTQIGARFCYEAILGEFGVEE